MSVAGNSASKDVLVSERALSRHAHPMAVAVARTFELMFPAEKTPLTIRLFHGDPLYPPDDALQGSVSTLSKRIAFQPPSDPIDARVFSRVEDVSDEIDLHRYRFFSITLPELRSAAHAHFTGRGIALADLNGASSPKNTEIAVGHGVTGLFCACLYALLDPKDVLLVPRPTYGVFVASTSLMDVNFTLIDTAAENDFKLSPEDLKRAFCKHRRAKCLLLVNPNNPTGAVYSRDELRALAEVLGQHPNVSVICDEIYQDLVFDESARMTSLASLVVAGEPLFRRTVTLSGVSKSMGGARLRVGIACGPTEIIRCINSFTWRCSAGVSDVVQAIAAAALRDTTNSYLDRSLASYRENLTLVQSLVERINKTVGNTGHWDRKSLVDLVCIPRAGFFVCLDFAQIRGARTPKGRHMYSDFDIARYLLEEANISTFPGSALGFREEQMVIRITLATTKVILREAFQRISDALERLEAPAEE